MSKPISQREARQLRKRVRELGALIESQRREWRAEWPLGKCLGRLTVPATSQMDEAVRVSRLLGHAVVVTADKADLVFFAMPADQKGESYR